MADDALTAAETHPFWLTYAHQHDSGRVCLLNQESDVWYIESGPGSGRVRAVCDRKHPEVSQVVREHAAAKQAEALREAADVIQVMANEARQEVATLSAVGRDEDASTADLFAVAYRQASDRLRDRAERLHPEPAPDGGERATPLGALATACPATSLRPRRSPAVADDALTAAMAEAMWEQFGKHPTGPLAAWITEQDCRRLADTALDTLGDHRAAVREATLREAAALLRDRMAPAALTDAGPAAADALRAAANTLTALAGGPTAQDVLDGRARYADTPGGHADRAAVVAFHAHAGPSDLDPGRVCCACGADTDDHAAHVARALDGLALTPGSPE